MSAAISQPESIKELMSGAAVAKPLRVMLFTDADVFAGTERHMFDLAVGLRDEGAQVTIACPTPAPLAEKAAGQNIPVVSIAKRGTIDVGAIRKLKRLLKSGEIDIIHSHNGRTALSASIAVRLAKRGRCVATQHFLKPNRMSQKGVKGMLSHAMHRWVSSGTHHFIAISEAARQGMVERQDAPSRKITVVPNGIIPPDTDRLKTPASVRGELGIALDASLVVCVARLEKEKDIGTLIDAMALVARTHPGARCIVAGEGGEHAQLQQRIDQEASLKDRFRLLGFRNDSMSLMNAGDVFVLPSLAEPFGLVLLEAMSIAKPVIATKAGGPLEIVADGETGLLVKPGDSSAMANAIRRLLDDPDTRSRMGKNGLERFQAGYTARRMCKAAMTVYQSAMES